MFKSAFKEIGMAIWEYFFRYLMMETVVGKITVIVLIIIIIYFLVKDILKNLKTLIAYIKKSN
jgi:hypothetical protein